MFSYILILLFLLSLYVVFFNRSNSSRKAFLFLAFFSLFLLSALRDINMGADSRDYITAFRVIRSKGSYYMEKGFVLFNRMVGLWTKNYSWMIAAESFLFFSPLYFYIRRNVNSRYWALCVFIVFLHPYMFLQTTFNVMRQCCSVGFLLIGMDYYTRNTNTKKGVFVFVLITILAAQFHRSAYFILAIPLIRMVKWTVNKWRVALVTSVLLNILRDSNITRVFGRLAGFNKYFDYKASLLNNVPYVLLIVILVIFITNHYQDIVKRVNQKELLDRYIFSLVFLVFAVSNDMVYRVYITLAILSLPAIPMLIEGYSGVKIRYNMLSLNALEVLYVLYYLCFFLGYIWMLTYNGNQAYIPYRFCF